METFGPQTLVVISPALLYIAHFPVILSSLTCSKDTSQTTFDFRQRLMHQSSNPSGDSAMSIQSESVRDSLGAMVVGGLVSLL